MDCENKTNIVVTLYEIKGQIVLAQSYQTVHLHDTQENRITELVRL